MAEIRIKVGASKDASVDTVFQAVGKAAETAKTRITKEMKEAGAGMGPAFNAGATQATKVLQGMGTAVTKITGGMKKGFDDAATAVTKMTQKYKDAEKTIVSSATAEAAAIGKVEAAEARAAAKAAARRNGGGGGGGGAGGDIFGNRFARRMGYWAGGRSTPLYRTLERGVGLAGDVARGAGIHLDTTSLVESYIKRQDMANTIAHMGYVPGAEGAAGQHANPADIQREATTVAKATGVKAEDTLAGLEKFTGFSSDLETGRKLMMDMAKLSSATGANMEDVASGAGKIAKQLGDVPDKAEAVKEVMRALAGMGREGNVDIKDFASSLAKIAPQALKMGGDVKTNIKTMGVLMQLGMAGGAAHAPEAATDAARFVEMFSKSATMKQWAGKYNIQGVFDKSGNLADPKKLMLSALRATGGNLENMPRELGDLFRSSKAAQVIAPLAKAYRGAGGGAAGEQAASSAFDKLATTVLSAEEVEREFAESQQTAKAKAEKFQASLEEIADKTMTRLIPAFESFAPKIEGAVDALGSVVAWGATNPGEALVVAVGASFAEAGLQHTIRMGVEKLFASSLGGGIAVASAVLAVGIAAIEIASAAEIERQVGLTGGTARGGNALNSSDPKEVQQAIAEAQQNIAIEKKRAGGDLGITETLQRGAARIGGQGNVVDESDKREAQELKDQTTLLRQLEKHLADIASNTKQGSGPVKSTAPTVPANAEHQNPYR